MTELDEFDRQLSVLCAGFNVPCTADRKDAYGKAFRKLPPMGWDRLVDYCLSESGPDRMPSVRDLWAIRKEMRAPGAQTGSSPSPAHDQRWHGDGWDQAANFHLLGYVIGHLSRRLGPFVGGPSYHAMKHTAAPNADASAEFIQNVSDLVHAKKQWAGDMRDLYANGDVPVELQRKVWSDYVETAEKGITCRKLPEAQAGEVA